MRTLDASGGEGMFAAGMRRAVRAMGSKQPAPPLWVAVTNPGTELDPADRGIGSLGVTFATFAEQEAKVKEYRRRIRNCNPVGGFVNNQVNTVNFLFCHEDDAVGG